MRRGAVSTRPGWPRRREREAREEKKECASGEEVRNAAADLPFFLPEGGVRPAEHLVDCEGHDARVRIDETDVLVPLGLAARLAREAHGEIEGRMGLRLRGRGCRVDEGVVAQ